MERTAYPKGRSWRIWLVGYLSFALACSLCPIPTAFAQEATAEPTNSTSESQPDQPFEAPIVNEPQDTALQADGNETITTEPQVIEQDSVQDDEESATAAENETIAPIATQVDELDADEPTLEIQASVLHQGYCGDTENGKDGKNITWKLYSDGTLALAGKGVTEFYSHEEFFFGSPVWPGWHDYAASITSVSIGEGITELNGGVLANLPNVTSVTLPSSMRVVDQCVFFNCPSLATVTLNYGLTTIGVDAFEGTQVTSLTVPPTLNYIDQSNFNQIPLNALTIEGTNPKLLVRDDVLFSDSGTTLLYCSRTKEGAYAVPSTVKKIGLCAFEGCDYLTSVTLPNGLTTIEMFAFHMCGISSSIVLPNTVRTVGTGAFNWLKAPISNVHVGSGLTDPGSGIFSYCDNIQNIELAEGPNYLGESALESCISLTKVAFPNSYTKLDDSICKGCTSLASVRIGPNVKTIGSSAFEDCTSLASIAIPKGVTSIGEKAFYNTAIRNVTLPNTVKSVGVDAFPKGCKVTYAHSLVPTDWGSYEEPGKITALTYSVTYQQSTARNMHSMVNNFRTGSEAWWYVNEVGGKKHKAIGLKPLTYDYDLERAAMIRAREIALLFSHTRPCGLDASTAVTADWSSYGENIAAGQTSASAVMNSWKETNYDYYGQGHRRNMLSEDFNAIGIGHVIFNGTHYWVQEFGYIRTPNTNRTAANDKKTTATTTVYNSAILSVSKKKVSKTALLIKKARQSVALPAISASGVVLTQEGETTWGSFNAKARVVWESDNPSIAKVSGSKVVAVKKGTTYVRAKAFGKTFKVRICVGVKGNVKKLKVKVKKQKYKGGKAITPSPTLKLRGVKLKKNVDYKLTYKKNKKRGTATLIITGIGHYVGKKTVTFKIV